MRIPGPDPASPWKRLTGALNRPGWAQALLGAFIAALYYDGLWGVPRHDQLVYLYEASQFESFLDILAHSPSWNRSVSVGDHDLYRPLLYVFLAAEYGLFGKNFLLWQATGILLHVAQALALYRLLRRSSPLTPAFNLLAAALFSSLTVPAEAVIWHHINGYLVFTLCVTGSLHSLLDHLERGGKRSAEVSVLLAIAGTFTYEAGVLYCGLIGLALAVSAARSARTPAAQAPSVSRATLAGVFFAIPVGYLALSLIDFVARFGWLRRAYFQPVGATSPIQAIPFALCQLAFWIGGVLLPSLYDIAPGSRTTFLGFAWPEGPWAPLNVAAASSAILGALIVAVARWRDISPARVRGVALGLAFAVVYSGMVALGRSVPRGLSYTLRINLYYAYIAVLSLLVALALGARLGRRAGSDGERATGPRTGLAAAGRWLLLLGVGGVLLVNAIDTMALLRDYRHLYSAPRIELLYHARRWHETHGLEAYFAVSGTCPGNEALRWFAPYLRQDVDTVHFIDVLYPETSANLNREGADSRRRPLVELSCADRAVSPRVLAGTWRAKGGPTRVSVREGEPITLTNEHGSRSAAVLDGRVLVATQWKMVGVLSHDDAYIFWSDSTVWWR